MMAEMSRESLYLLFSLELFTEWREEAGQEGMDSGVFRKCEKNTRWVESKVD